MEDSHVACLDLRKASETAASIESSSPPAAATAGGVPPVAAFAVFDGHVRCFYEYNSKGRMDVARVCVHACIRACIRACMSFVLQVFLGLYQTSRVAVLYRSYTRIIGGRDITSNRTM